MKKKKLIISILFFMFLIFITFHFIFLKIDFDLLLKACSMISIKYIFLLMIVMILYFLLHGVCNKAILKILNVNVTIFKGIFYSITEFLFNSITPGASGGQPVAYYCMVKDDIPGSKSFITLVLNTIMFKIFFVVFEIVILLFRRDLIFENGKLITIAFFLALALDVSLIIIYYLLIFNNKIVKLILKLFYIFINKFKKNKIDYESKIEIILDKYSDSVLYIKNNKLNILKCIFITFIQRSLMFLVTPIIYKSFGLNGESIINVMLVQIFAQLSIEAIPLPGGTGAIEIIINEVMFKLFNEYTLIATFFIRIVTFYVPLLIIIILFVIFGKKYFYKK